MKSFAIESAKAKSLARHYASKGYKVFSNHGNFQKAKIIAGVRPDIVAKKGNKVLIIEVKSNASLTRSAAALDKLSRFAQSNPGYRFDLVVANPPYAARDSSTGKYLKKSYATKHPKSSSFEVVRGKESRKDSKTGQFVSAKVDRRGSKKKGEFMDVKRDTKKFKNATKDPDKRRK